MLSAGATLASALTASLAIADETELMRVSVSEDTENPSYTVEGPTRSTPPINAPIIATTHADIDGDGVDDWLIIDDRDSVSGSGIAVVYDTSSGAPYAFWACRLQRPTVEQAIELCRLEYGDVNISVSLSGLQYLYNATRDEGAIDWETQHIAIPNWTAHVAHTLTQQSVDLARRDMALASEADREAAVYALHNALLLREQHAILHPTGE